MVVEVVAMILEAVAVVFKLNVKFEILWTVLMRSLVRMECPLRPQGNTAYVASARRLWKNYHYGQTKKRASRVH